MPPNQSGCACTAVTVIVDASVPFENFARAVNSELSSARSECKAWPKPLSSCSSEPSPSFPPPAEFIIKGKEEMRGVAAYPLLLHTVRAQGLSTTITLSFFSSAAEFSGGWGKEGGEG